MFNLNIRKNYLANLDEMFKEIDKGRYGIISWEGIVEIIQRALYIKIILNLKHKDY